MPMHAVQLLEGAVTKMPESDMKGVWREWGPCVAFSSYRCHWTAADACNDAVMQTGE